MGLSEEKRESERSFDEIINKNILNFNIYINL
jgi:hypothetical protein